MGPYKGATGSTLDHDADLGLKTSSQRVPEEA